MMTKRTEKKIAKQIEKLEALELQERIDLVTEDVESKTDKYAQIDSHTLAELLGCGDSGDWSRCNVVRKDAYEGIYDEASEVLVDFVTKTRYRALEKKDFDVELLTDDEKDHMEQVEFERRVEEYSDCNYTPLCFWSAESSSKTKLRFEGYVEDDGACIDLMGPYEARDGKFTDLDADDVYVDGF